MDKIIEEDIKNILKLNANWDKLKEKNVLVTGATGMVGQYIVFTLLELNNLYNYNIKIWALCKNEKKVKKVYKDSLNNDYLNFIIQNVEEKIEINRKINYVFHTASPANPKVYSSDPVGTIMANTIGTRNTLEIAKKYNSMYCYISTMEIYGKMDNNCEIKEEEYGAINSLELRSCYPESKKLGENMCVAYNEQYGVDIKIIRPAYTYGPGMSIDDSRVQCEFMKKVIDEEDIIMKSDGKMQRTYTYVADVVSGIFFAVLNGQDVAYNVANENAVISIRKLAETIIASKKNSKSKLIIEIKDNNGWSKVAPKIMDCSKLTSIGWKPIVSVKDGIKRTMEFNQKEKRKSDA